MIFFGGLVNAKQTPRVEEGMKWLLERELSARCNLADGSSAVRN